MLVRCPDCRTEYDVSPPQRLEAGTRVRCPRCRNVFGLPAAVPAGGVSLPRPRSRSRIADPVLARRLARAMVSEIVLTRRGERDLALDDGTVLTHFGPAIAAAFRLYGDKVAAELPDSRRIFREAVNDILGGGRVIL